MMLYPLEYFLVYVLVTTGQFTVVVSNAAFIGSFSDLFTKFPFHSLPEKSISIKRVPNEMHCSMNCQRNDNCFSFNFAATNDSVGNFVCELLSTKHSYKHKNFKTNDSFHHFSWKIPQDFCSSNVKSFPSLNSDNTYDCPCKEGFTGLRCEIDIDECVSSPCVNGKCKDKVNSFECSCHPGYAGVRCETDINECQSNPCVNGTCEDKVNSYKCNCIPGFNGRNCEVDINECANNPCNAGQCIDKINEYECKCNGTGFTGKNCETDIDECASNPCRNGSTCLNKVNAYNCTCEVGFTGKNCETEVQPCDSNPCKNNGTCNNLSSLKYSCNCNQGYYGINCQFHIYFSNETKIANDAQKDCKQRGMLLAKIWKESVNNMLQKLFKSDSWIGLRKKVGGDWIWSDNAKLQNDDYSNWDQGEPIHGNGWCVFMDWTSGKWKADRCSIAKYHFACLRYT